MNHSPESSSWERLTHTPRGVPISIILRLMIGGLTFGVLWFNRPGNHATRNWIGSYCQYFNRFPCCAAQD